MTPRLLLFAQVHAALFATVEAGGSAQLWDLNSNTEVYFAISSHSSSDLFHSSTFVFQSLFPFRCLWPPVSQTKLTAWTRWVTILRITSFYQSKIRNTNSLDLLVLNRLKHCNRGWQWAGGQYSLFYFFNLKSRSFWIFFVNFDVFSLSFWMCLSDWRTLEEIHLPTSHILFKRCEQIKKCKQHCALWLWYGSKMPIMWFTGVIRCWG